MSKLSSRALYDENGFRSEFPSMHDANHAVDVFWVKLSDGLILYLENVDPETDRPTPTWFLAYLAFDPDASDVPQSDHQHGIYRDVKVSEKTAQILLEHWRACRE